MPSSVDLVKQFLTRYVQASGMALEVHLEAELTPESDNEPTLHVQFTGPDVPLLLDRRAELLNALEHLAAKLLGLAPEEHHRVRFDAANYKSNRDGELQAAAAQAIAEVLRSGHPFRLAPMNSRERRIVHLLAAEAGLRSASTGDGPFRSVTLSPNPDTIPQPPVPPPAANDARTARLRKSFGRR